MYAWGLYQQNIGITQIVEAGYTLCWAAKWLGEKPILQAKHTDKHFLTAIHALLDAADAVVHYNGKNFDVPTLNKEFIKAGLTPPSPYKQIDLLKVARKQFKFTSNKLDFICKFLGLGIKVKHKGFDLWKDVMDGDEGAWKKMLSYNKHDIVLLEKLYNTVLPWIDNHPSRAVYDSKPGVCPNCGSSDVQRRGTAVAIKRKYVRLHCQSCGTWSQGDIVK